MTTTLQERFEAAGRTPPPETLDLDALIGTGRRRRRRRRTAWASCAVLAGALVVGTGVAGLDAARNSRNSSVTTGPDGRRVAVEHTAPGPVVRAVASALDDGPITWPVAWVSTTEFRAAAVTGTEAGADDEPIYVVEVHGRFTLEGPQHNGPPQGSVLIQWLPAHDREPVGDGLSLTETHVNLARFGTVHYYTPAGVSR